MHGHSLSLRPTFFCSRCPSKDHRPRRCNQAYTRPQAEGGELVSIFAVIASVPGPGEAGNPAAKTPAGARGGGADGSAGAGGGRVAAGAGAGAGRDPGAAASSKRPFKALCMLAEAGRQLEHKKRSHKKKKGGGAKEGAGSAPGAAPPPRRA